MNKTNLAALIHLIIFFFGCTKEEADFRLPEFEVPVIHGYFVRAENSLTVGYLGYATPNVNLGDGATLETSNYYLLMFPNPIHNFLTVEIKSPDKTEVKKLWITHAVLKPPLYSGTVLTDNWNNFVAGGSPVLQKKFTQNTVFLDLTDLPDGYYRLYIKVNDHLLYDNLVVDREFIPFW